MKDSPFPVKNICLIILTLTFVLNAQKARGRVKIVNNVVMAENGHPLRGENSRYHWDSLSVSDEYWENLRNKFHLNTIRIMVYREPQSYQGGCFMGDCIILNMDSTVKVLNKWVKASATNGFYCIIDYHPIGDHDKEDSYRWWKIIAPLFANETHVIYELANEPVDWDPSSYNKEDVKWQDSLFRLVRELAPETHILTWSFATGTGNIVGKVSEAKGINYENASVAFHAYQYDLKSLDSLKSKYPIINSEIGGEKEFDYTSMITAMEGLGISSWILQDGVNFITDVAWKADPFFDNIHKWKRKNKSSFNYNLKNYTAEYHPHRNSLHIKGPFKTEDPLKIFIYGPSGNIIRELYYIHSGRIPLVKINVNDWNPGTYEIVMKSKAVEASQKIVVEK